MFYEEEEKPTQSFETDTQTHQTNTLNQGIQPERNSLADAPSFPQNIPEQILNSDHLNLEPENENNDLEPERETFGPGPNRNDVLTFTESEFLPKDRIALDSEIGVINELVGPNEKFTHLTTAQIKQDFVKNNYKSNFSMGPGYDDFDEVERNFKEMEMQLENHNVGDDREFEEMLFLKKEGVNKGD